MSAQKKVSAFIIRGFEDAGTGEKFVGGKTRSLHEGQFTNYKAAGLVRAAGTPSK